MRLVVSTNATLHRIPDSTDWETWERKRAFLVCNHCHHWVRRMFTACGCLCHRPSNAQEESRIDVRHFSGTTKGKYQRRRDVA